MRRVGAATVAVLLGLALAASAARAQPPAGTTGAADQGGWWGALFGGKPKTEPAAAPAPRPLEAKSPSRNAAELNRLRECYMRRQDVCDRLRKIALQTDNAALDEEAKRLDDRAWKIFMEKSAPLMGRANVTPADLEPVAPLAAPKPPAHYAVRQSGLMHQASGGEGEQ
jgi:hypothetical protein